MSVENGFRVAKQTHPPLLILASASPRRQELLRHAGISFRVLATGIREIPEPGESPRECAERLARAKALSVSSTHPGELVLGADTIVALDRQILGKPADEADAARMLRLLAGRIHEVTTGVCLAGRAIEDVRSETTLVSMIALTEDEIRDYVASREPLDKAGAYAIQGRASRWIPRIEGDYANVVGLPVAQVYRMLRQHGVL